MSFGIDDAIALFGDLGGAADAGLDVAGLGAPAAIDTANNAFTAGTAAPALDVGANVLSEGPNASAFATNAPGAGSAYPDQPSEFYHPPGSQVNPANPYTTGSPDPTDTYAANTPPNPNQPIGTAGVGRSGTLGDNSYEQPSEQMSGPMSGPGSANQPLPMSPAEAFRTNVGALPGKWYDAFAKAPADIANYAGEHPFKSAALLGGLGLQAYGMANRPSPPTYNFAQPSAGRGPAAAALPKPGPPSSPIVRGGTQSGGRGGMSVGL